MDRKTYAGTPQLEFKDDAPGVVLARFATLNVVDADGDVTLPGAFGVQQVRMQPYGHDTGEPSIGKGMIREEGDAAIAEMRINLAMATGRETYESLKFDFENGPPQQEFSYIFDIIDAAPGVFNGRDVRLLKRMKVHSVDPVFLGAGINTATLSVKEKAHDAMTGTHTHYHPAYGAQGSDTGHTHEHAHAGNAGHAHDHAPKAAKAITLPDGMSIGDLEEQIRDEITEAFPGLFGGDDMGCWLAETYDGYVVASAGCGDDYYRIAYAVDAAGEVTISGQPEEVDRIVSWVPTAPEDMGKVRHPGQTYADHAEHALTSVQAFVARSKALAALREGEGRTLSAQNQARLASLLAVVKSVTPGIEKLLDAASPAEEPKKTTRGAVLLRFAELDAAQRLVGAAS